MIEADKMLALMTIEKVVLAAQELLQVSSSVKELVDMMKSAAATPTATQAAAQSAASTAAGS